MSQLDMILKKTSSEFWIPKLLKIILNPILIFALFNCMIKEIIFSVARSPVTEIRIFKKALKKIPE